MPHDKKFLNTEVVAATDPIIKSILEMFPGSRLVTSYLSETTGEQAKPSFEFFPPFATEAADLHAQGWAVIPQQRYDRRMPAIVDGSMLRWKQWKDIGPSAEDVEYWRRKAGHENIAIILGPPSGNSFCIDIDVLDKTLAAQITDLAVSLLGATILRFGERPKAALLYRGDPADLPRNRCRSFVRAPGELDTHKLEIHCYGKLITVSHLHYKTGFPFEYHDEKTPWTCRPEDLPLISNQQLDDFLSEVEKLRPFASTRNQQTAARPASGELTFSNEDWIIPAWRAEVKQNRAGLITEGRKIWLRDMSWDFVRYNAARVAVPSGSGNFEYSEESTLSAIDALYEYANDWISTENWDRNLREEVDRMVRRAAEKLAAGEIDHLPTTGRRQPAAPARLEHKNTLPQPECSRARPSEDWDLPDLLRLEDTRTPGTPHNDDTLEKGAPNQTQPAHAVQVSAGDLVFSSLLNEAGVAGVPDISLSKNVGVSNALATDVAGTPAEIGGTTGVPGSGYISSALSIPTIAACFICWARKTKNLKLSTSVVRSRS